MDKFSRFNRRELHELCLLFRRGPLKCSMNDSPLLAIASGPSYNRFVSGRGQVTRLPDDNALTTGRSWGPERQLALR